MAKNRKSSSNKRLIFLLISAVLIVIFANLLPKIQVYINQPQAAALLTFPQDHASHPKFKTEWWYLNLLTKTLNTDGTNGKDLGYVLSFSRLGNIKGLLSSRYDQNTKSFNEKTHPGGDLTVYLTDNQYLFVQYSDASSNMILQEQPTGADRKRVYKLTGSTPEIGTFSLILKERTVVASGYNTPLLWGGNDDNCRGRISVFAPNDTFYYSIPNLDITGTITDIDGVIKNVKIGKAWIDHQWFNSSPPSDWKGHYWSSFHYTGSTNLYNTAPHQAVGFVTQIYNTGPKYTYWVKRGANGTNQCGEEANITVNNYGSTNYPSSWKIELKKSGSTFLEANGSSFSDNQIYKLPIGPQFVESSSYYTGKRNGESFTGLGFFETHLTRP